MCVLLQVKLLCILYDKDPGHVRTAVILGVLDHLGIEFPLSVLGLGAELQPKVCFRHQLRAEGICATG